MNNVGAICFDLDGTLLDDKGHMSEKSENCINKLKRTGVRIVIVTGRHYREIPKEVMNYLGEDDIVISCDGQYIYYKNRIIYQADFLKINDILAIKKMVEKKGNISFYSDSMDYLICRNIFVYFKMRLFKLLGMVDPNVVLFSGINSLKKLNDKFEKIVTKNISIPKIEELKARYTIHCLRDGSIELLHKKVNKYSALEFLISNGMILADSILYFGDDENDRECFENLKYTIAMGNATEDIKRLAYYVTLDNTEDGIEYALNSLKLFPEEI